MAADWEALSRFLRGKPDRVEVSWRELEDVVGGMPASSIDHVAWWSGDRPHTRAWEAAGFAVVGRDPGVSVTFQRVGAARYTVDDEASETGRPVARRVRLISCSSEKSDVPARASGSYVSAAFRKARDLAEAEGDLWFILSAEHGLVQPAEWLAPYDRYLPDTPPSFRRAWGEWVVARLDLLAGPLRDVVIEVHAGEGYVVPLRPALERLGARLDLPLAGLRSGERLAWYGRRGESTSDRFWGDPSPYVDRLTTATPALTVGELALRDRIELASAGLYGWYVDQSGADDLARGLRVDLAEGLIYVGQTGATRWPSGTTSSGTLAGRLASQHFRGRRSGSTFRLTIGSVLDEASGRTVERDELSGWMAEHLRVVPVAVEDRDSLGDLERQVVQAIDPPLNLGHVGPSPLRERLTSLRRDSTAREVV